MSSWEKVALYAQLPFKQLFEESRYRSNDWSYHPEIPPPTRPRAERRPIRTKSPLCNVCRSALEYYAYVVGACKAWQTSAKDLDLSEVVAHHRELNSLFDEAFSYSCHLCIFLASYVRGPENEAGMWRYIPRDTQVEMSFNVDFTERMIRKFGRLHFSSIDPKRDRNHDNYWNFLRLEIWPTEDIDGNSRHIYSDEMISAIPKGDNTGSDSSQRLAKEWLDRCQKNEDGQHVDCNTLECTWLPTRLLDVRHALKTSVLRLVSSRQVFNAFSMKRRSYITLSHCWGKWGSAEIPVLTSANERDRHEKGISIQELPQTFRDAITVAQWFQGKFQIPKHSSNLFIISCSSMALDRLLMYHPGQRCGLATRGFANGPGL